MPEIVSAALFERDGAMLAAHRAAGRGPFAGQWLPPLTIVRETETAEDALRRHAREQFGVLVDSEAFLETVYVDDPDDKQRYITNIFRAGMGDAPMRFRADGEYDDARWVVADELAGLWMPPPLRDELVRVLAAPDAPDGPDGHGAPAQGVPLAERTRSGGVSVDERPPPDNHAGWESIAAAWQEQRYGDRFGTRLMWTWRSSEDELQLLDDVRGKRGLVLGCGGGQDVVALEKLGANVVGIDQSASQIAYARKYSGRHDAPNASFVEGEVEDLSRFDDDSFDFAVSISVMEYVERLDLVLAEAARVLRAGAPLYLSVKHPLNAIIDGGPPFVVWTSYWAIHHDETQPVSMPEAPRFRSHMRTFSGWFDALAAAGFAVERVVEPREDALPAIADELSDEWMSLLPCQLILKARKR
jgi:SAM-dependent methyltransferase/8-oxo-dGTP pyrophosphatase MutT (NUDIX family)